MMIHSWARRGYRRPLVLEIFYEQMASWFAMRDDELQSH